MVPKRQHLELSQYGVSSGQRMFQNNRAWPSYHMKPACWGCDLLPEQGTGRTAEAGEEHVDNVLPPPSSPTFRIEVTSCALPKGSAAEVHICTMRTPNKNNGSFRASCWPVLHFAT